MDLDFYFIKIVEKRTYRGKLLFINKKLKNSLLTNTCLNIKLILISYGV